MVERTARREAQRERRRSRAVTVRPIQPIENKLPPLHMLDGEGEQMIHDASMRMLAERGILIVDYPPALETFRQNGATVEGITVRIDEATLMHFVGQAPSSFTLLARNPQNHLPIGGKKSVFAPVYGPPFAADMDRGRRQATLDDFQNFVKLAYMAEEMHCSGGTLVEPNDIPLPERHLDMLMAHILYSDKSFMGSVTHKNNAADTVRISEILFGAAAIRENPATLSLINASSPLRFDDRMFGALEVYALARQAVIVTPFIIAGAMSPSTLAATLAQQNAEALFGICYAQMLNPGTPWSMARFWRTST